MLKCCIQIKNNNRVIFCKHRYGKNLRTFKRFTWSLMKNPSDDALYWNLLTSLVLWFLIIHTSQILIIWTFKFLVVTVCVRFFWRVTVHFIVTVKVDVFFRTKHEYSARIWSIKRNRVNKQSFGRSEHAKKYLVISMKLCIREQTWNAIEPTLMSYGPLFCWLYVIDFYVT